MWSFIVMAVIVFIFTRIYINKFDLKGKNVISLISAISLTGFLNIIQLILHGVLSAIF
jgi:hypothetical protein